MFSEKFSNIIERVPDQTKELKRILDYLDKAVQEDRVGRIRLDPRLIQEIARSSSSTALASLIYALTSEKILRRTIVVSSQNGGGLAEFESFEQIPTQIHDWQNDTMLDVTSDKISTVYKVDGVNERR